MFIFIAESRNKKKTRWNHFTHLDFFPCITYTHIHPMSELNTELRIYSKPTQSTPKLFEHEKDVLAWISSEERMHGVKFIFNQSYSGKEYTSKYYLCHSHKAKTRRRGAQLRNRPSHVESTGCACRLLVKCLHNMNKYVVYYTKSAHNHPISMILLKFQ